MPTRRLIKRWWTHALTACFFLLSVVPTAVFAANGVIATNNCHILSSLYGVSTYPGFHPDVSVKTYGVTRDLYSYFARFKDSTAAALKADIEATADGRCLPVTVTPVETPYRNGGPVYDLLSDNTLVLASLVSSPRWLATWAYNNPACNSGYNRAEIMFVESIYAPLQKVNQPFHGFSDESVDLINATCLSGGKCSIRLSGPGGTNGALADVEPGKVVSGLRAEVTCDGAPSDKAVTLTVKADANTGGHNHHDSARPPGALSPASGNSPVTFSFTAPAPAGDHAITAKCVDGSCGEDTGKVWVGHKGLQSLTTFSVYRLIGDTSTHPDNHYLTLTAASRVAVFAAFYQAKYPTHAVLHLNDASLERGGIFDLYPESSPNWKAPHDQHCRGTVIDIRANGAGGALDITSNDDPVINEVKKLGRIVGADPVWEVPEVNKKPAWRLRHFHTKLMGQEGIQCP